MIEVQFLKIIKLSEIFSIFMNELKLNIDTQNFQMNFKKKFYLISKIAHKQKKEKIQRNSLINPNQFGISKEFTKLKSLNDI